MYRIYIPSGDKESAYLNLVNKLEELLSIDDQRRRQEGRTFEIIVMGDLNANLSSPSTVHDVHILRNLKSLTLPNHFWTKGNGCTWRTRRNDKTIWSKVNYVLATNSAENFQHMREVIPEGFDTDRKMVSTRLRLGNNRDKTCHKLRLRQLRNICRVNESGTAPPSNVDRELTKLEKASRKFHTRPTTAEQRRKSWVNSETWKAVIGRAKRRQQHELSPGEERTSSRRIARGFKRDRKHRMETTAAKIEKLMKTKQWYTKAAYKATQQGNNPA